MNVVLPIPDELAERLGADATSLARQALEALALEAYRTDRITRPELRRILGFETRYELDGFLKERGVFHDYTMADLEQERQDMDRLGL